MGQGAEGQPVKQDEMMLHVGGEDTLLAFTENLRGMSPGEEKDFDVTYPEDYGQPKLAGRTIRFHPDLKPDGGANVNFVVVRDEHSIDVRTYERGVEAETFSCGSGVVASVATCALVGKIASPVSVLTRSGIALQVTFTREGNEIRNVHLTGDARLIYTADFTPETIEGFDPDWVRQPGGYEVAR